MVADLARRPQAKGRAFGDRDGTSGLCSLDDDVGVLLGVRLSQTLFCTLSPRDRKMAKKQEKGEIEDAFA